MLFHSIWLVFFFIMGACIGSFLNVVVYRLPNDMSVSKPTFSFCPACKHQLEWWENVPIAAWFYLKAKCSHCGIRISFQYPGVEAFTAVLFALLYWWYYMAPGATVTGLGAFGFHHSAPAFIAVLIMVAGLIAGTLIDYRYYVIPTQITWTISAFALILMPLAVFTAGSPDIGTLLSGRVLPHPVDFLLPVVSFIKPSLFEREDINVFINNIGIGMAVGGLLGVAISSALVHFKIMPRSFDDYDAFMEAKFKEMDAEQAATRAAQAAAAPAPETQQPSAGDTSTQSAQKPARITMAAPLPPEEPMDQPDMILTYPFARREMVAEVMFLAIPTVLAILFAFLLCQYSPWDIKNPQHPALIAFAGAGFGYLIGGLSIWLTRILGTLFFGKEAMGLGDVHLMAAMGAVLGPVTILVVYLVAPFLGVGYWLFTWGVQGVTKKSTKILPYGPFLAIAALACMVYMRAPLNPAFLASATPHPKPYIDALYPSDEAPTNLPDPQTGLPRAIVSEPPGTRTASEPHDRAIKGSDLKPITPYQPPVESAPAPTATTPPDTAPANK
jgi:leader peptidase (prepilin peptidase) / N-methyltransferase